MIHGRLFPGSCSYRWDDSTGPWPHGAVLEVADPARCRLQTDRLVAVIDASTGEPVEPGNSGIVAFPGPGRYHLRRLDQPPLDLGGAR